MKITCAKDKLNYAVQAVQKAVAAKTPLPILTGIYLAAHNNKVELQATDYEIGISCTIDAAVHEPGEIVLSGKYFQEMVRRMPGDIVNIESSKEDRTIKITAGMSQFNLLSLPAEEFPVLRRPVGDNLLSVKDEVMRDLIRKTIFACSTDEARPIFTGGLLEADENGIRLVATNTHRLALKKASLESNVDSPVKMIIPAKILNELARVLNYEEPMNVSVYWLKNQVMFAFDDIYIISRLIEGQFPDYNKVIPASFNTVVKVNTRDFLAAVERVSLLAREGEYNVIKFNFANQTITITSNNPDIGKAFETVPGEISGNDIEIAFNARYVTDILKNIDSDDLYFSLNTPLSPALIKPVDDENYTYIITPVRTN
ncbi:MAG: DNA polymerase III subunit beta [Negativicutes bacterium]|nr:DNA polymerase III subunit beta [Negativicutes bacterium]